MSKEEKEKMFMRVVELREKGEGLLFKQIGIRLGISECHAHSIYKRMKGKTAK